LRKCPLHRFWLRCRPHPNHPTCKITHVCQASKPDTTDLLYLFTSDAEGKILCEFDLDFDGVWDVKESPTRHMKYIFFEKDWLEVDEIKDRNSEKPTATKGDRRYEFSKSWKLAK